MKPKRNGSSGAMAKAPKVATGRLRRTGRVTEGPEVGRGVKESLMFSNPERVKVMGRAEVMG